MNKELIILEAKNYIIFKKISTNQIYLENIELIIKINN
jgi:hypothetical protein